MRLDINTDAVVKFTNTLEKLHKSALPSAVRGALNDAVFDVKTKTMLKTADDAFEDRQPNFFKANSRFENATGFNVDAMKATVGFVEGGLKGGNNYAVKDLEEQEHGGSIDRKSFIPMDPARSGNSKGKPVRPNARLQQMKIIRARNAKGKNDRQKFIKSVFHAGKGGYVLAVFKTKEILWKVNSLRRTEDGHFKLTPVYNFRRGRKVTVHPTGFMKDASLMSAEKIEQFYIQQAERQMKKFNK